LAYELHIERPGREISLEEWRGAVARTPGVRLAEGDVVGVNPSTTEEIRVRGSVGDVEVLFNRGGLLGFGAREEWVRVFRFVRGRASFKPGDTTSQSDPVRKSAVQLARALGAIIVGDEGEEYKW
jgi:hypothetical protein